MLSHNTMGFVALFVLWGNTLLVVLAALGRAGKLSARRASLRPIEPVAGAEGLVRGRVETDGAAELSIEQVGRYGAGEARSILWHDRRASSVVREGELVVSGTRVALDPASPAQVWPDAARAEAAAACQSPKDFEDAWPQARKARGHARTLSVPLRKGEEVWIAGRFEQDGDALRLRGTAEAPVLLSTVEPRALLAKHAAFLRFVFAPGILLACAAVTGVALWPPALESTVSKIGGLLAFGFFLIVLPAGTGARDRTLLPHERPLRGRWLDPSAGPAGAKGAATGG
jgi:hypothetical protein